MAQDYHHGVRVVEVNEGISRAGSLASSVKTGRKLLTARQM